MALLPESPRWLIKRGREEDAAAALSRLTRLPSDHPEVTQELNEIKENLEHELAIGESSYADCFRWNESKIGFRTLTGIFIQAWQQLTGSKFALDVFASPGDSPFPSLSSQLHLLLRHHLLPAFRHRRPFPHHHCHQHRQCLHDFAWYVRC